MTPDEAGRESFLALDAADQRDAFLVASEELGRSTTVLEKDVWVCWTLDTLFSCHGLPRMAFKGGTSLSKVFGAIDRFSEDIDVTMDHADLAPDLELFDPDTSRKQRGRDDELLKGLVLAQSNDVAVPHLRGCLAELGLDTEALVVEDDGATLVIKYPHIVEGRHDYYSEGVKIEFGGRNMIEPNETYTLMPYLADALPDFDYPTASVPVLSPMRTF